MEELTEKTEEDICKIRNLSRKGLEEIKWKLEDFGLTLKDESNKQMTKVGKLRDALRCLKDEYIQYVDNACHCDEYDDNEECPYCYAKRVLKETK